MNSLSGGLLDGSISSASGLSEDRTAAAEISRTVTSEDKAFTVFIKHYVRVSKNVHILHSGCKLTPQT